MALHKYPDSFPPEVIDYAVAYLTGQPVDVKEFAHAAWHIAGLGLSKWDVHPPLIGALPPYTKEEAAAALKAAKPYLSADATFAELPIAAIDWMRLLPLLIQLLQELFKRDPA